MSEQSPINPDQVELTAVSEEMSQQQKAIRGFVEARVQDSPMENVHANLQAKNFGLEAGKYDVYADSEHPLGGGFNKFVSKEDPSDTLMGLSDMHIGGPTHDPDRYVYNYLLRTNGDIVGKIWTENSRGQSDTDIHRSASSSDPESAKKYRRVLGIMHTKAQALTETSRHVAAPESTSRPTKGRIKQWMGRLLR